MIDDPPEPFNAGDRASIRAREKDIAKRTRDVTLFMAAALDRHEGRTTIHELLQMTGIWASAAVSDSNMLWHREGQRAVGLRLWDMAWRANPAGFKLMLDEHETR